MCRLDVLTNSHGLADALNPGSLKSCSKRPCSCRVINPCTLSAQAQHRLTGPCCQHGVPHPYLLHCTPSSLSCTSVQGPLVAACCLQVLRVSVMRPRPQPCGVVMAGTTSFRAPPPLPDTLVEYRPAAHVHVVQFAQAGREADGSTSYSQPLVGQPDLPPSYQHDPSRMSAIRVGSNTTIWRDPSTGYMYTQRAGENEPDLPAGVRRPAHTPGAAFTSWAPPNQSTGGSGSGSGQGLPQVMGHGGSEASPEAEDEAHSLDGAGDIFPGRKRSQCRMQ